MNATQSVLFVGSADPRNTARDALLQRGHCHLAVVADYPELFAIPKQQKFEIAILYHISSGLDFRDSSAYIRRTWPAAKVVVICRKEELPDDPLYDEWIAPEPSPEMLVAAIERLAASSRKSERGMSGPSTTARANQESDERRALRGIKNTAVETARKPDLPFDLKVARREATNQRQPATEISPAGEHGSSHDVHATLIHDAARRQGANPSDQCGGLLDNDGGM